MHSALCTEQAKGITPNEAVIRRVYDLHLFAMKLHDATHRHFDLRLECDGSLLSWAIPVESDLFCEAIEMDDHRLANIMFEGVHRTGPIMLWDFGVWELHPEYRNTYECLRRGLLRFNLYGSRLDGGWILRRTGRVTYAGRPIWAIHNELDLLAGGKPHALQQPRISILTRRNMDMIVHDWNHPQAKRSGQMNLF